MSAHLDLNTRPRHLEQRDYYDAKRNCTHYGIVCSIGPVDHLAGTAQVYIPALGYAYTVTNNANRYASTHGVGSQTTLSYGDGVVIAFESGDAGRPYITGFKPHLDLLPDYVKNNLAPAVGTVFENVVLHPLPISTPPEAVRFGYTGQAEVYSTFLVK
jgi:hypothetical protein